MCVYACVLGFLLHCLNVMVWTGAPYSDEAGSDAPALPVTLCCVPTSPVHAIVLAAGCCLWSVLLSVRWTLDCGLSQWSVVCGLLAAVWSVCVNVLARTRRPNEQAPSPTKVMSARKRAGSMMCWSGADGPNAHKATMNKTTNNNYTFNKSLRVCCLLSTV